jgi:hypothetical protein
MPYLGRAPTGTGSVTEIDGDLKITGQLTSNDTLFKMTLDGTDGSSTNTGDNFLIEDGGTDGSGTDAGDDICIEKDTTYFIPGQNILGTLSSGIAAGNLTGIPRDGWEFVSAVTASNSATVSFTGFETGYDYRIDFYNLLPASDSQDVYLQLGISGPTYRTSGYLSIVGGTSVGAANAVAHTTVMMLNQEYTGNAADEHTFGYVEIKDPAAAADTYMFGHGQNTGANSTEYLWTAGSHYTTAEAIDAVKIYMQSGNLSTGEFKLYKRANV